jgi:hypothetical protein
MPLSCGDQSVTTQLGQSVQVKSHSNSLFLTIVPSPNLVIKQKSYLAPQAAAIRHRIRRRTLNSLGRSKRGTEPLGQPQSSTDSIRL